MPKILFVALACVPTAFWSVTASAAETKAVEGAPSVSQAFGASGLIDVERQPQLLAASGGPSQYSANELDAHTALQAVAVPMSGVSLGTGLVPSASAAAASHKPVGEELSSLAVQSAGALVLLTVRTSPDKAVVSDARSDLQTSTSTPMGPLPGR